MPAYQTGGSPADLNYDDLYAQWEEITWGVAYQYGRATYGDDSVNLAAGFNNGGSFQYTGSFGNDTVSTAGVRIGGDLTVTNASVNLGADTIGGSVTVSDSQFSANAS